MSTLSKLDKVGEKLVELFEKGVDSTPDAIKKLAEFVETQTPLLGQEIVALAQTISWLKIGAYLFSVALIIFLLIYFRKEPKWDEKDSTPTATGGVLIFVLIIWTMTCTVPFFATIEKTMKPIVAPRLYMLEYTTDLVKGRK